MREGQIITKETARQQSTIIYFVNIFSFPYIFVIVS